jgi:hypothetical protein
MANVSRTIASRSAADSSFSWKNRSQALEVFVFVIVRVLSGYGVLRRRGLATNDVLSYPDRRRKGEIERVSVMPQ